jgi:hypothetical protein
MFATHATKRGIVPNQVGELAALLYESAFRQSFDLFAIVRNAEDFRESRPL